MIRRCSTLLCDCSSIMFVQYKINILYLLYNQFNARHWTYYEIVVRPCVYPWFLFGYKKAVLSQGGPRDAAVNFDMYRMLQRHRTCGFRATARLCCWSFSTDFSESSVKK